MYKFYEFNVELSFFFFFLYTGHIVTTSSSEPYSFMQNNSDGIQNRQHCSLNNQEEKIKKVCKEELPFLYATHPHDLFFNCKRVFKLQS